MKRRRTNGVINIIQCILKHTLMLLLMLSPFMGIVHTHANNYNTTGLHGDGDVKPPPQGHRLYYPAIFVFGDSLSDSGNNNNLITIARAVRPPYGRDFPTHQPTGRFSNGLLAIDYIAQYAGIQFPPPYASIGDNVLQGVNFASAGSGVLNTTGSILGQHISLYQQLEHFKVVKQVIEAKLGQDGARQLFSKSLFYISTGNNDYLNNYLLSGGRVQSPLQLQYTSIEFANLIQSSIEEGIKELYEIGARKFGVSGTSVFGCVPFELLLRGVRDGKCLEHINNLSKDYNMVLAKRVPQIQDALPHARVTYLNSYDFVFDIISNPKQYGFLTSNKACCGVGPYNGVPCIFLKNPKACDDPSKYVFWDSLHPTSTVSKMIADKLWFGTFPNVSPYNLQQLATLDL